RRSTPGASEVSTQLIEYEPDEDVGMDRGRIGPAAPTPPMNMKTEENIRSPNWVPNVSGGLVVSKIEQRTSWDIDYNRTLAQIAERNGFDYALSQIRFTA